MKNHRRVEQPGVLAGLINRRSSVQIRPLLPALVVALVMLAGCCGATLRDPGVAGSLANNAQGWKLAAEYAAAAGWPAHADMPGRSDDPKVATWRDRFVAWRAQAMILDYAAQGGTMSTRDAYAAAEAEVPR